MTPAPVIKTLIIAVVVSAIPLFFLFVFTSGAFHRLTSLRRNCDATLMKLREELARRRDLFARVIEMLRGWKEHRVLREAATAVGRSVESAKRNVIANPSDAEAFKELARTEAMLKENWAKLLSVANVESEAKADAAIREGLAQFASANEHVAAAGHAYNEAVASYNAARQGYPARLICSLGNFQKAEPFAAGTVRTATC